MKTNIEEAFKEWLVDEHYRVAQAYRLALAKEIAGTFRVMGKKHLHEYKELLIASLKQIQIPSYNSCPILLNRDLQTQIYDATNKPDFKNILKETIDELDNKQY